MSLIKPLAIYLPQFHSIPENDKAWGKGFTEWTNVNKARPLFGGHYQPHEPHESLGYYNLSDPEVMIRQAAMAKEHGIYGFAYYHYWFNGKRLLNQPLDTMLNSGKPEFPFCYIWANENWTKRWDGLEHEVIIKQEYSHQDDLEHIRFLCEKVFSNKNYILIKGKPVFIVYRTELFPDINATANIWRNEVLKYGFKGIYLVRVESFGKKLNPQEIGFDAAMEFSPDGTMLGAKIENPEVECIDYPTTVINSLFKNPDYKLYRCVFPLWDNTARRGSKGVVFVNGSSEVFKYALKNVCEYTMANMEDDDRFVFINAWNEWGEGCHLEPDVKNGFAYLECCKQIFNESINTGNIYSYIQRLRINNRNLRNSRSYKIGNLFMKPISKFLSR